jgi:hypothetical protein
MQQTPKLKAKPGKFARVVKFNGRRRVHTVSVEVKRQRRDDQ